MLRRFQIFKNGFYENFQTLFLWANLFPFRFVGDCFPTFLVRDGASSSSSFSFSRSRFRILREKSPPPSPQRPSPPFCQKGRRIFGTYGMYVYRIEKNRPSVIREGEKKIGRFNGENRSFVGALKEENPISKSCFWQGRKNP